MAIDPNILLQGIVPDVVGAAGRGFQLGQNIKQAPLRNQLLEQQAQQGGQAIASNEQSLATGDAAQGQRLAIGVNSVFGDTPANEITPEMFNQGVAVLDSLGAPLDAEDRIFSPENAAFAARLSQSGKAAIQQQRGGGQSGFQTNAPVITQDADGQKFFTSLQSDRATGEQRVTNTPIDGNLLDKIGLSAGDQVSQEQQLALAKEQGKIDAQLASSEDTAAAAAEQARQIKQSEFQQKTSVEAFKSSAAIEDQLRSVDKAITALEKGADTGIVARNLPTFTQATQQLEEAANELGIKVINSATFGALSATELKLALDTGLPKGLGEDELLPHLQNKRAAMVKLRNQMDEMGEFLSEEGNSVADWRAKQKEGRGGDITEVTTQEQFDALSPGSQFMEDGVLRVKK